MESSRCKNCATKKGDAQSVGEPLHFFHATRETDSKAGLHKAGKDPKRNLLYSHLQRKSATVCSSTEIEAACTKPATKTTGTTNSNRARLNRHPRGQERQQLASRRQSAHKHQGPLAGHRRALVEDLTSTCNDRRLQLQLFAVAWEAIRKFKRRIRHKPNAHGSLCSDTPRASYKGHRTATLQNVARIAHSYGYSSRN